MNLSLVDFTCVVFWQVLIDQLHKCSPKKLVHLTFRLSCGHSGILPGEPSASACCYAVLLRKVQIAPNRKFIRLNFIVKYYSICTRNRQSIVSVIAFCFPYVHMMLIIL